PAPPCRGCSRPAPARTQLASQQEAAFGWPFRDHQWWEPGRGGGRRRARLPRWLRARRGACALRPGPGTMQAICPQPRSVTMKAVALLRRLWARLPVARPCRWPAAGLEIQTETPREGGVSVAAIARRTQYTPCASIASATFTKPLMLAPST